MPYFDEYAGFDRNMTGETPPAPPAPQPNEKETAAHTIFDYAELLIITVFFVLLASTFLFRHAVVVGLSMQNTLEDGEHLIISDLFYTPKHGDIVVLESHEEAHIGEPIIKRVIGIEGDTIEIRREGVYRNGELLQEDYAYTEGNPASTTYNDYIFFGLLHDSIGAANDDKTAFTYHVGENEVFVLGDNRFNSTDGRAFGPVNKDSILGRVVLRLTPLNRFGGVD